MSITKDIKTEIATIAKQTHLTKADRKHQIDEDLFFEAYLKNGLNATEAALEVFHPKNRNSAARIGSYYKNKCREAGRVYMEQRGLSYGKILEVIAGKAMESDRTEFMDRLLVLLGYHNFIPDKIRDIPVNITINQKEKDILAPYIDGEIEELQPLKIEEETKKK